MRNEKDLADCNTARMALSPFSFLISHLANLSPFSFPNLWTSSTCFPTP